MTVLIAFLGYILGVMTVCITAAFCTKFRHTEEPTEEVEHDEKEAKLTAQWEELLNYDGNIKE